MIFPPLNVSWITASEILPPAYILIFFVITKLSQN
jgi:hypothetical protein